MESLQTLIDNFLLKEDEKKKDRVSSGLISPSRLGRCYRFQFLARRGDKGTPVDARARRIFAVGHIFEDWIDPLLPAEIKKQVLVAEDDIKGYADYVTEDTVIDLKTTNDFDFNRFWDKKKTYDVYEDKKPLWLQVACYGRILKKRWVALFFVGKSTLNTEQFVAPTERFEGELNEELSVLRNDWKSQSVPKGFPRAYHLLECHYCIFSETCPDKVIKEKKKSKDESK